MKNEGKNSRGVLALAFMKKCKDSPFYATNDLRAKKQIIKDIPIMDPNNQDLLRCIILNENSYLTKYAFTKLDMNDGSNIKLCRIASFDADEIHAGSAMLQLYRYGKEGILKEIEEKLGRERIRESIRVARMATEDNIVRKGVIAGFPLKPLVLTA